MGDPKESMELLRLATSAEDISYLSIEEQAGLQEKVLLNSPKDFHNGTEQADDLSARKELARKKIQMKTIKKRNLRLRKLMKCVLEHRKKMLMMIMKLRMKVQIKKNRQKVARVPLEGENLEILKRIRK